MPSPNLNPDGTHFLAEKREERYLGYSIITKVKYSDHTLPATYTVSSSVYKDDMIVNTYKKKLQEEKFFERFDINIPFFDQRSIDERVEDAKELVTGQSRKFCDQVEGKKKSVSKKLGNRSHQVTLRDV